MDSPINRRRWPTIPSSGWSPSEPNPEQFECIPLSFSIHESYHKKKKRKKKRKKKKKKKKKKKEKWFDFQLDRVSSPSSPRPLDSTTAKMFIWLYSWFNNRFNAGIGFKFKCCILLLLLLLLLLEMVKWGDGSYPSLPVWLGRASLDDSLIPVVVDGWLTGSCSPVVACHQPSSEFCDSFLRFFPEILGIF